MFRIQRTWIRKVTNMLELDLVNFPNAKDSDTIRRVEMGISPQERQWFAGYFDDKISVNFYIFHNTQKKSNGEVYYYNYAIPLCTCGEVKFPERVLVLENFSGKVNSSNRKSLFSGGDETIYNWQASGKKALRVIKLVEPFLGLKRYIVDFFYEWEQESDREERVKIAEKCIEFKKNIKRETRALEFLNAPTNSYIAGLFDSSGSMGVDHKGMLTVILTMYNNNLARLVHERFGGHISEARGREVIFPETGYRLASTGSWKSVVMRGKTGMQFLQSIRPYLMVNNDLVDTILVGS